MQPAKPHEHGGIDEPALVRILEYAEQGADLRRRFFAANAGVIAASALRIAVILARGNKVMICGNGGSAADAQHMAAEFVNRFLMDRPPLPALALTTDSSILTAVGNDFSFDQVFAKQINALGKPGDLLIALSTSGNSVDVLRALEAAREGDIHSLGLTGNGGGKCAALCDCLINVDSTVTPLIQEIHITVTHLLCGLTDYYLFDNVGALTPWLKADNTQLP
ncbi:MAG: D-sedoheptulose 7-phosphate isomerase [Desulfovibrio sp.]|jgi:D-sedoheptulose 7-phosphate isomerase|nr:D-sedoheptulose 7-phosphate isomerase [Desulfovibrio sp.]